MRKYSALFIISIFGILIGGCATSTPIENYNNSKSHFSRPPELIKNNYPATDIYRVYRKGGSGFKSIETLREATEARINEFATRQGKTYIVLGERTTSPPYILGNFPTIEIVFALVDKPNATSSAPNSDKLSQLEKLKKLYDDGALTKEEYESEKKKILDQK